MRYEEAEPLWDARPVISPLGELPFAECRRRLLRAIPTSTHARRLADAVLEQLGDRGRLDPYTDGRTAKVLWADRADWWLRRSPVTYCAGADWIEADVATEAPWSAVPVPPPEPILPEPDVDIQPEGLEKAVLTLWTGEALLQVRYGDDGMVLRDHILTRFGDRWSERRSAEVRPPSIDPTARPPQVPPPAWFVDLPDGLTPETLADRILAEDPARDPVRVRMNVDAPGGVEGNWYRARVALRKLAWEGKLPTEGCILVMDAFEHPPEDTAMASGPDFASAEARWLVEHERVRPKPVFSPKVELPDEPELPEPPTETETIDEDGKTTRVFHSGPMLLVIHPVRAIPWPIPGPRTTPAVAVRIPPLPTVIPEAFRRAGFTEWRYLVGDSGHIGAGLLRVEADGFTLVGDGAVDLVDPDVLEAELSRATAAERPFPFETEPWVDYPYEHRHYALWSPAEQRRIPARAAGTSWNEEWNWRDLEADVYRWQVMRMRYRGQGS